MGFLVQRQGCRLAAFNTQKLNLEKNRRSVTFPPESLLWQLRLPLAVASGLDRIPPLVISHCPARGPAMLNLFDNLQLRSDESTHW